MHKPRRDRDFIVLSKGHDSTVTRNRQVFWRRKSRSRKRTIKRENRETLRTINPKPGSP